VTEYLRPRRVALIDRPWLGHTTVALATPLAMRPAAEIRAVVAEFMRRNPTAPIACRIDSRSGRWLPVPAAEHATHLDRAIVAADDPDPADLAGHVLAHLAVVPDLPVLVVVSRESIMIQICHAVGDAVTLTRLLCALALADQHELGTLAQRVGTAVPARALLNGAWRHQRDWRRHLYHRNRPPVATPVGPAVTPRPSFTGAILSNGALRDITRWRNANARGASLTCVLTAAMYKALTLRGVPMDDGGFYALIDMRTALPERPEPYWGNMSKSLYLAADPGDPRCVDSALRAARSTHRALPASVVGAVSSVLTKPRSPMARQAPVTPVTLTFNSMPVLPGLSDLPWRNETNQRFYAFGPSRGPGGISVCAIRLRGHMELTASFDEATVNTETLRDAMESLSNVVASLHAVT
jgi:hypothetical protein